MLQRMLRSATPKEPKDPYFSNVSLLMSFDGAANSTTFVDSSQYANSITRIANTSNTVRVSTTEKKIGTGSAYWNVEAYGYLQVIPNNYSIFNFGTNDFTIEFWYWSRFVTKAEQYIIDMRSTDYEFVPAIRCFSGTQPRYLVAGTATGNNIEIQNWYHLAYVRSNGVLKQYTNGNMAAQMTDTRTYTTPSQILIGIKYDPYTDTNLDGYLDELRITKGVARYTSNFTPETTPFPKK
jgi:hypothetical protein